jgi:hypothetical protein
VTRVWKEFCSLVVRAADAVAAAERVLERRWRRSADRPASARAIDHSAEHGEEDKKIGGHSNHVLGRIDKLLDSGEAVLRKESVVCKGIEPRAWSTQVVRSGSLPLMATARTDIDVLSCSVELRNGLEDSGGAICLDLAPVFCGCDLGSAGYHLWRLHGLFHHAGGKRRGRGGQKAEKDLCG